MTDLEKHVNRPGRDKLVKKVREKINELGITYIYYQFISVTGRVVGKGIPADHWERSAFELLSYPEVKYDDLNKFWDDIKSLSPQIEKTISAEALYDRYLVRQQLDIERFRRDEKKRINPNINYKKINGLSNENKEKLMKANKIGCLKLKK